MPEPTGTNGSSSTTTSNDGESSSSPLTLLRAVTEVQERRISIWHEYEDAFSTYLNPSCSPSSTSVPINGSQNAPAPSPSESDSSEARVRGCAGCSRTPVPLTEELLAQILQITTQALIECGHRLRTIQTELAHSTSPQLARLVDSIQANENALLRNIVQRDQLRKTVLKPATTHQVERDDVDEQSDRIATLDAAVDATRAEIAELMQEVYAESLELQQQQQQ